MSNTANILYKIFKLTKKWPFCKLKAIVRQNGQKWSLGAELQSSKKIRKSTTELHICFRKETALKATYIRKIVRPFQKVAKFFPYCRFAKAAITRKKVKNGLFTT